MNQSSLAALLVSLTCAAVLCGCGGAGGNRIVTDQLRPLRTIESATPSETSGSLDARMTAIAEQMEQAGLERGSIWEHGFVPSGSRETLRLEIPADTCATIVALASTGVRDVDAILYLPDGTQVAQDNQADSHPTLQVCADGVGRYFYYTLHAYEGAGAFLVASFIGERALFAQAAAIVGGRPGVAQEAELTPEEQVAQSFSDSVQRRGFAATKEPVRLMLASTQSVRVAVDVEVAHCYTVAAFALDGLEDINLRVIDEKGRDVAFDDAATNNASTQFCADHSAQFNAELIAARGQGAAVLAVYAVDEADMGGTSGLWLGMRSRELLSARSLSDALREDSIVSVEAGFSVPSVRARGRLAIGEAVEHKLTLEAGTCMRIAASGGEGTGTLRVEITEAKLTPAAERKRLAGAREVQRAVDESGSTVAVGGLGLSAEPTRVDDSHVEICSVDAQQIRALVISRRGYGDYAVATSSRRMTER